MFGITGIHFPEIVFINVHKRSDEKTDAELKFILQEIEYKLKDMIHLVFALNHNITLSVQLKCYFENLLFKRSNKCLSVIAFYCHAAAINNMMCQLHHKK